MSVIQITKQAIAFQTDEDELYENLARDCNCVTQKFCQLLERQDQTQFQVDLSEATGIELINDGTFSAACGTNWTCGTDWSIAANVASKAAGSISAIEQTVQVVVDNIYKVVFTVANITAAFTINLGGQIVILVTPVTGNRTYTVFYLASTVLENTFKISSTFAGDTADFSDISVQLISTVGLQIKDPEGVIVYEESDGTSITYSEEVAKAQIELDWSTITPIDDCYTICLFDIAAANLVSNGDFSNAGTGWIVTGSSKWSFASNTAVGDATGGASPLVDRRLSQALTLTGGRIYTLQFDVLNFVGGTVTASTNTVTLTSRAANGTFSEDIDLTAVGNQSTIRFTLSDNAGELDIDNVIIFETAASILANTSPVLFSECLNIMDEHICTLLLTCTNNSNAFGLDFINFTLVQSFRHVIKDAKPVWRSPDRSTFRNSTAEYPLLFGQAIEVRQLELASAPEYIHQFWVICWQHRTVTIDGVPFATEEDDYEPDWIQASLLAQSTFEVIEQSQDVDNSNCL